MYKKESTRNPSQKHYRCSSSKVIKRPVLLEQIECSLISSVWLFVTPWTVAHQAPLSLGFSRQEYWSGLPFPSPGDLPNRDWTWVSCIVGRFFTIWATGKHMETDYLNGPSGRKVNWNVSTVIWITSAIQVRGQRVFSL